MITDEEKNRKAVYHEEFIFQRKGCDPPCEFAFAAPNFNMFMTDWRFFVVFCSILIIITIISSQ